MALNARFQTLRPERDSGWLVFFELVTESDRKGHFFVVGPGENASAETARVSLAAGQAAVRYFKETPSTAPPETLLEGAVALFRTHADNAKLPLEYGCGVLEGEKLWLRTQGEVRLLGLHGPATDPVEAPHVLSVKPSPEDRLFFGYLPEGVRREEILAEHSGGQGGLILSFQASTADTPKPVPEPPAPKAVKASKAQVTGPKPTMTVAPPLHAEPAPPAERVPKGGGSGSEGKARIREVKSSPATASAPATETSGSAPSVSGESSEPKAKAESSSGKREKPLQDLSALAAPEEGKGLGFWLGLVVAVLGVALVALYLFVWREPVQEFVQDTRTQESPPTAGISHGEWSIQPRWSSTFSRPVTSTARAVGGKLVFGCRDGSVNCVDPGTGALLWAYAAAQGFGSSPAIAENMVIIGCYDGSVYGLDLDTGTEAWVFQTGGRVVSSPVVHGDLVLVGSFDRHLYALSIADGALRWKRDMEGVQWASPVVEGDVVITAGLDGSVTALEVLTGGLRWVAETGGPVHSSPMVAERKVFLGSEDAFVYALDLENGEEIWKIQTTDKVHGSPAYREGRIVIGVEDGTVLGIDVGLGEVVWTGRTRGPVRSRPGIYEGVAWVTSYDGSLWGFQLLTGQVLVEHPLSASTYASPLILDGTLFVGSMDGTFAALQLTR